MSYYSTGVRLLWGYLNDIIKCMTQQYNRLCSVRLVQAVMEFMYNYSNHANIKSITKIMKVNWFWRSRSPLLPYKERETTRTFIKYGKYKPLVSVSQPGREHTKSAVHFKRHAYSNPRHRDRETYDITRRDHLIICGKVCENFQGVRKSVTHRWQSLELQVIIAVSFVFQELD